MMSKVLIGIIVVLVLSSYLLWNENSKLSALNQAFELRNQEQKLAIESLQNDFIRLRFNQLPEDKIINFLNNIVEQEKLNIHDLSIRAIQKLYKSDIRSMINCLQSNQYADNNIVYIITDDVWANLILTFQNNKEHNKIYDMIRKIEQEYKINYNNIIKDFLYYIIRKEQKYINTRFLSITEYVMHFRDGDPKIIINYLIYNLIDHFDNIQKVALED